VSCKPAVVTLTFCHARTSIHWAYVVTPHVSRGVLCEPFIIPTIEERSLRFDLTFIPPAYH
jgi:hypothetical protein